MKENSKPARERRKAQAQERQAKYNALSTEQRLAQIDARPGNSARERARLAK